MSAINSVTNALGSAGMYAGEGATMGAVGGPIGAGVGALIGGGIGLVQSLFDARQSRENTNRTIEANKQLAEYQYSRDLEQWNRGNAYNAPEAQMERLKKAGLNPNLVYGSGSVVGNYSGSMPHYQAPTVSYNYQPVDITRALGDYQDTRIRQAQHNNLRAQHHVIHETGRNKHFINEVLSKTKDARLNDLIYRINANREKWDQATYKSQMMMRSSRAQKRMLDYQLQFQEGRNRLQDRQIEKVIQDTGNKRLQNRYFLHKLFGNMGIDAVKTGGSLMKKRIPFSRGGVSARPRYNSPTSWKNAGY
ncbi:MAG: DNA pilot protein [Microvirus sp.]|nr:MAG: DNA pilot protein [Microvirus sp.]